MVGPYVGGGLDEVNTPSLFPAVVKARSVCICGPGIDSCEIGVLVFKAMYLPDRGSAHGGHPSKLLDAEIPPGGAHRISHVEENGKSVSNPLLGQPGRAPLQSRGIRSRLELPSSIVRSLLVHDSLSVSSPSIRAKFAIAL
jgi:hypothetical protein